MLEGVKKMGKPTPSLDNRPELYDDLAFVVELFQHLHATRTSSGFGPNAISMESMESVFRLYGIDDLDERLQLIRFFIALDQTYLKIVAEEMDMKSKKRVFKGAHTRTRN